MTRHLTTSFCVLVWLLLSLPTGSVPAATFVVNSSADRHDALPGDGIASDHPDSALCTLRAAIEEAGSLTGSDTIVVPAALSPLCLRLGALRIEDNHTCLRGEDGWPVIDGIANLINHATVVLASDSNQVTGLILCRSRGDAITIFGAHNRIGGTSVEQRVTLVGNGLDNFEAAAIHITGWAAVGNIISGCYIGLEPGGMTASPNRWGVRLEHYASRNLVGGPDTRNRNLISGNNGCGIMITTGAFDNRIAGNFVGPDSTGNSGPGNRAGGILITSDSHHNVIGGETLDQGNLISANPGHGIELAGPKVTAVTINGNIIGATGSGRQALGNTGDGIRLVRGTHDNLIGGYTSESGNLISGNGGNGILARGEAVCGNLIKGNWIGVSLTGYASIGNGWILGDGILVDSGAHHNLVGGTSEAERNVCSGNHRFGVHLDGAGTNNNAVRGNFAGVNATGTSSIGNAVGVVISDGAQSNVIGGLQKTDGNVISGNRAGDFPYGVGVMICGSGTDLNQVSANIIGLDAAGLNPRRNGHAGVVIGGGARFNTIGGDNLTDGNTISGNGIGDPVDGQAGGIHLFGATTRFNRIAGNLIGLDSEGGEIIGNIGHGIGLYSGASDNRIGGEFFREMNMIVGNDGAGVFLGGPDTERNLIRGNIISENAGLGIEIRDFAQGGIWPPTIVTVGILMTPGARHVAGNQAPPGSRIDFYEVASPDPSGAGEANFYLASVYANANGIFDFYLPYASPRPIILTAIATDQDNNSSAFAVNGYSPDATSVDSETPDLPHTFALAQNYPNPFNLSTIISFDLPRATPARLTVLNILGRKIRTLLDGPLSAGSHLVEWDGRDGRGEPAASGPYLYRLETERQTRTRKMLLLK